MKPKCGAWGEGDRSLFPLRRPPATALVPHDAVIAQLPSLHPVVQPSLRLLTNFLPHFISSKGFQSSFWCTWCCHSPTSLKLLDLIIMRFSWGEILCSGNCQLPLWIKTCKKKLPHHQGQNRLVWGNCNPIYRMYYQQLSTIKGNELVSKKMFILYFF